jgi:hypothetical protein
MAPSATSTNGTTNGSKKLDFTTFHNTINGQPSTTTATRHGINPATKKPLPEVPIATPQDVNAAVAAAREAFKEWSQTSVEERAEKLTAFGKALEGYQEEFAGLLTKEQGKPVCCPLFLFLLYFHFFSAEPSGPSGAVGVVLNDAPPAGAIAVEAVLSLSLFFHPVPSLL